MGQCPLYRDEYVCERDPGWILPPLQPLIVDSEMMGAKDFEVWSDGLKQTVDGLGATLGLVLFIILFSGLVVILYL